MYVALRKESVDRNCSFGISGPDSVSSLSARRAWIEIVDFHLYSSSGVVALRKESVDRNIHTQHLSVSVIEVALRKESVDRNSRFAFG